jgi:enoyl-[acyl-carrier protein] reductase/trans-2-enoyl-CoA reductase (NAD+)
MIIQPKTRGFICTTAHPQGCAANVQRQIQSAQAQTITQGPKRVLVIGSSTGYGLASRISAAFSCGAATLGVFFEKPATDRKLASAGWYNTAAFDAHAKQAGLYAKHINADAFAQATKAKVIETIAEDLGQVDMVIYSLASPVRKMPQTEAVVRSCLKPIGQAYQTRGVDLNSLHLTDSLIEPATAQEIQDTVAVMGGDDWSLWIHALKDAGVLAPQCQTLAYSYIGTELTHPIYWNGTIGQAKKDLERTAHHLNELLGQEQGSAHVAVMKSVITQASAAIPMLPLYIAIVFKKMREQGLHEDCIMQTQRLFHTLLAQPEIPTDALNRIRLDDWELRDDVQQSCLKVWQEVTTETLESMTEFSRYQKEFLQLFGFDVEGIDYDQDVEHRISIDLVAV